MMRFRMGTGQGFFMTALRDDYGLVSSLFGGFVQDAFGIGFLFKTHLQALAHPKKRSQSIKVHPEPLVLLRGV